GIDNYNFTSPHPWSSPCPICDGKHGNYGLHGEWYCENGNQFPYDPELGSCIPKISWNIVLPATLQAINSSEDPFEKNFQFYLDTSKIQTIGLLKNAIIASQKLNVATKEVKLWRVDFPLTGINEEQKLDFINKCTNVNINIRDELDVKLILVSHSPIIPNTYLFLCLSFLLLIVKPAQKTHSRYRRATWCW
ncbi:hypothetical protein RclHR1_32920001, partial [Rhizophagus clarus]